MRHRNSVKQLGRTNAHRKAMFSNMVTSLFKHERIITTKQKGKELKRISDRLITRARKNLDLTDDQIGEKLHNKRIVMKSIHNRDIVKKLFDDIALRYKDSNKGGYVRLYLLGKRPGDAAEMALVELVKRKAAESETKPKKEKKEKRGRKKDKDVEKASE
jgi:large subunit ribosomal protein L17